MLSRWAFRFLLFYVCILYTQPQNRFLFLYPLHIADLSVGLAIVCHLLSCGQEGRPILRFGPATVAGLVLLVLAIISQYAGACQTNTAWNGYIDIVVKSSLVMILLEAMCTSVQRVWAVQAVIAFAVLWWIKGGLRLAAAGATYAGDRLMGPAVSLIENPNGFAYMLCVALPIYLYFARHSPQKWMCWSFLACSIAAIYLVLKTGSRTGYLTLIVMGIFLAPKYVVRHRLTLLLGALAVFLIMPHVGAMNLERFRSIPMSFKAFLTGEAMHPDAMNQDQQSAQERRFKNRDTWRLIKKYPVFGVGMNPDESLFADEFTYATGQVHCEVLMAGRQMGLLGVALYVSMITIIAWGGHKSFRACRKSWFVIADLGWTFRLQAVAFAVGGSFSPLPWNTPMLILVASSSALWTLIKVDGYGEYPAEEDSAVSRAPAALGA